MNNTQRPFINRFNRLLLEGKSLFGVFGTGPSAAQSNMQLSISNVPIIDYVIVDFEHFNSFSRHEAQNWLFRLRNVAEIVEKVQHQPHLNPLEPRLTPFMRVPKYGRENSDWMVKVALDCGYHGVVFPSIENAEQAEEAVKAMRYPDSPGSPRGRRGSAGGLTEAIYYWGLKDFQSYKSRADVYPLAPHGDLSCILQIESQEGVDQLDQILNVPGITAIFIGHEDLRLSSQPSTIETYKDNVSTIVDACKKRNIPVGGGFYGQEDELRDAIQMGQRFFFVGADVHISQTPQLIKAGWDEIETLHPKNLWRGLND